MVYSLKEAAEQQRLTELPFIKFNLLLSAWTVAGMYHYTILFIIVSHSSNILTNLQIIIFSTEFFVVGINNGIFPSGFSLRKSLDMILFGSPFIGKAYFSIKDKLDDN